ncbi:hypothetical protein BWO90_08880 (plasmid) [Sinorhizobium meliloti]|nr:hypothetical protein BWO90_08880 [Sinorhizobium meliloti]
MPLQLCLRQPVSLSPKYLGLPGRFRHAFIPQAHTRRYITDVELLTGLGVAAFILAISVLVGHEV